MASPPREDPTVVRLRTLFLEHPAWVEAARHTAEGASSKVFFSHRPGEPWHLIRSGGRSLLRRGAAPSPDFAFRFTPAAVERLAGVEGGVADIAGTLFTLMLESDPELRVGFRVIASFPRLIRHGYVRLLVVAGPRLAALGARHGVRSPGDLRRLVRELRAQPPASWETA